ncbi:MAG: hypothetical protein AAF841_00675 [Pseudomonadota bacterium]
MATRVFLKRIVDDAAGLEDRAEIAIGTTGFRGDGQRMFIQWNGVGLLLDQDTAAAFLKAARETAADIGFA